MDRYTYCFFLFTFVVFGWVAFEECYCWVHLEQVQDFTPTPMTVATEAWYTGFHPYTLEPVFSAKTQREKLAQRQFFFWYKPEERKNILNELRRIGRQDLVDKLYGKKK